MKRNATSELNHKNWDKEEEKVERGEFVMAHKSIISHRKIIQSSKQTLNSANNVFTSFTGMAPDSKNTDKNKEMHINALKLLNKRFLEFIQKHISDNPICVLTHTLEDYNKNLDFIKEKYPLSTMSDINILPIKNAETFSSSLSTKPDLKILKEKIEASDNFSFGLKNVEVSELLAFPTDSSNSEKTIDSTEKFGIHATLSAEVKITSVELLNSSNLFGIPNNATMATFAPSTASECKNEEEECIPPVAEVRDVKEKDSVYKVHCKLFYQLKNEWKIRGVGNLFIKPIEKGKFQIVLRADNSLATIILNIFINDKMPLRVTKNNIFFVAMKYFCKEMKLNSLIIRVKTPEEAETLLAAIKKQF